MIELRRRYSGGKGSDSPSFSRLPAGYQEVEWVENHGDAYINTGIVARKGITFYLDYMFIDIAEHQNGAGKPDDGERFIIGINQSGQANVAIGSNANLSNTLEFGIKYKFILDEQTSSFTINDKIFNIPNTLQSSITTICIFARNNRSDGITYLGKKARCYACRIEIYSDCLLDLIPCYRTSDRKPGMYDIINGVFYTNAGTGEFLVGADVHYNIPPEYQEVEYLEGTKGAYIDPNISIGVYSAVEVEFMITDVSESIYHTDVFGYSGAAANFLVRYESCSDGNIFMANGTRGSRFDFELNKRYNVKINKKGNHECIINDINELIILNGGNAPTYPAYIMGSYGLANGKPYAAGCQRNYLSKFYENGSLVRNLIPCFRKSDNEAGMYDLVSGEFYTNAGTGEFIVGPDII